MRDKILKIIVAKEGAKDRGEIKQYLAESGMAHLDEAVRAAEKYSCTLRAADASIERLFATAPHSPEFLAAKLRALQQMIQRALKEGE